jgi:hypothetical protein
VYFTHRGNPFAAVVAAGTLIRAACATSLDVVGELCAQPTTDTLARMIAVILPKPEGTFITTLQSLRENA